MTALPKIYLITDRKLCLAENFFSIIESLLHAGLKMLQLREKDLSAAELYPLALQLRKMTHDFDCRLLINDRVDIVLATDADGVHLGNHSIPVATARKLLGPEKLIGASTHRVDEISAVANSGADFVTFGPVFQTPSKAAYGAPVGLKTLAQACERSQIPVYALGGVNAGNIAALKQVGNDKIAMISAIFSSPNPADSYQKFAQILID